VTINVPPGSVTREEYGWSIRWYPTSDTSKVALLRVITDDGVLELEHIRTIRTSCRHSSHSTDTDADPCEVPDVYLAYLRDRGYAPAHVGDCDNDTRGVAA
jgi:hypothetical protein